LRQRKTVEGKTVEALQFLHEREEEREETRTKVENLRHFDILILINFYFDSD
jgi:hypothetical protein